MNVLTTERRTKMKAITTGMLVSLLSAVPALAQESEPTSEPATEPNLLAGPDVSDEAVAPTNDPMTATREQNPARMNRPSIPPRLWIREIRDFNLTEDQRQTIDAIIAEFEQAQRAYVEEHGAELREIVAQLRQNRRGEAQGPIELRQRIKELREEAPKFDEYQKRIWEELDGEQRARLTVQLEQLQETIEAERARRRTGGDEVRRRRPQRSDRQFNQQLESFDDLGRRRYLFLLRHQRDRGEGDQARQRPGRDRGRPEPAVDE